MKDIWHFIIPEWRKLDHLEKERAGKNSTRTIGWRRWIPFLAVPFMAAHPLLNYPYNLIIICTVGVSPPLLIFLVYRGVLRRACWAILAARGEPICTACGYNLTGNVSGVCPECGKATSAAAD